MSIYYARHGDDISTACRHHDEQIMRTSVEQGVPPKQEAIGCHGIEHKKTAQRNVGPIMFTPIGALLLI